MAIPVRNEGRAYHVIPVLVFVLVAVSLLLLISDETISKSENRTLASRPSVLEDGRVNLKFPSQFESWFNDHIGLRSALMSVYGLRSVAPGRFAKKNGCVWDRDTGFVWTDKELDRGPWSDDYAKRTAKGLARMRKWLAGMGADFYLLLVPDKAEVYRDEALAAGVRLRDIRQVQRMLSAIREVLGDKFIYPAQALSEGRASHPVYYKTSHHWSEYGAFIGWRETASRILADRGFEGSPSLSEEFYDQHTSHWIRETLLLEEDVGCSAKIMGYSKENCPDGLLGCAYRQYVAKSAARLDEKRSGMFGSRSECRFSYSYANGVPLKIYVTGTSHTCIMRPFMPYTFAAMEYVRLNGGQVRTKSQAFHVRRLYEDEIRRFKPDVVLLCVSMANLRHIQNLTR